MVDITVDVNPVLAQPENGRGRPLNFKQRHRAECLADLVALVAPAAQAHKAVLRAQLKQYALERFAAVQEGAELVVEGHLGVRDHENVGIVGQLLPHVGHNESNLDAVHAEGFVAVPGRKKKVVEI